jgi:hypothetical protein
MEADMTTEDTTGFTRRRTVLALAASVVGLAAAGAAEAADLVDLRVVDRDTGEVARVWRHDGRMFVEGRPGARYAVRVTNNTAGRVMVVMSVDGVNILTGETAGYDQRGYVFRPYETYDVSGWRKSDTEVAAFTFAPLSRSYAARTGRPGDVGVIGVAAFTERAARPIAVAPAPLGRRVRGREAADSASEEVVVTGSRVQSAPAAPPPPSAARSAPVELERRSEKLGTAHGAREWSEVTTVSFERATPYPQLVRRIEYDSRANLVANGVIAPPARVPDRRPRPFPSSPGGGGYVPDPPGWWR